MAHCTVVRGKNVTEFIATVQTVELGCKLWLRDTEFRMKRNFKWLCNECMDGFMVAQMDGCKNQYLHRMV